MNILRRLPLSRLLLLCGLSWRSASAPPRWHWRSARARRRLPSRWPKPSTTRCAARAQPVQGVSARIQFTNHLLEGASLAGGGGEAGQLSSSPLISGASGRLWIAADGQRAPGTAVRKGRHARSSGTGRRLSMYDASTNTLYRYTPKAGASRRRAARPIGHQRQRRHRATQIPTVAEIEEDIAKAAKHATSRAPPRPTWPARRPTRCACPRAKTAA